MTRILATGGYEYGIGDLVRMHGEYWQVVELRGTENAPSEMRLKRVRLVDGDDP